MTDLQEEPITVEDEGEILEQPLMLEDILSPAHESADPSYIEHLPNARITEQITEHFSTILTLLGIDYKNDPQTAETPERFARLLFEVCAGRYQSAPNLTVFPNQEQQPQDHYPREIHDEMVVVGPIRINSLCAHHFVPVIGNVYIGYVPGKYLVGLSKFSRVAQYFAQRPQIQEVMTTQIFNHLWDNLEPKHLAVFVEAIHFCMYWRGVCDAAMTSTSKISPGIKRSGPIRSELMNIISDRRKPII